MPVILPNDTKVLVIPRRVLQYPELWLQLLKESKIQKRLRIFYLMVGSYLEPYI